MEFLTEAALSVWGVAGGVSLLAAVVAAAGLRGRMQWRATAALLAGAAGFVALALTVSALGPAMVAPQAADPATRPAVVSSSDAGLQLLADAEALLNRGDAAGARTTLERALDVFRSERDLAGQGHVYLSLGRIEHFTGQSDAARANFEQGLELYRMSGGTADEARLLMAWGDLERDTFQGEAAAELYRRGRQSWAAAPEPKSDPHVLLQLDTVAAMPEGEAAAWAVLDQATLIFENIGDSVALVDIEMTRAEILRATNLLGSARGAYVAAAASYRALGNHSAAATAALRAAEVDLLGGHNLGAREMLDHAEASLAEESNPAGQALVLLRRGDLARMEGDTAVAGERYRESAEALGSLAHTAAAEAWRKLGKMLAIGGDSAAAGEAFAEALQASTGAGQAGEEAAVRFVLGQLAADSGDGDAARQHWTAALELARGGADHRTAGRVQLALAGLAGADANAAREAYSEAAAHFRAAAAPMGEVLVAVGLAELARAEGVGAGLAAAVREANDSLAALAEPVAEANRLLGLPPVERIDLILPGEVDSGEDDARRVYEAYQANREANLAAHPDHNREARNLVSSTLSRIETLLAAAN